MSSHIVSFPIRRRSFLVGTVASASLALLSTGPALAQSGNRAGEVTRVRGQAYAVTDGRRRTLEVGTPIYQNDRLRTRSDTRVEVKLDDDSVLTLGDESLITVDSFVYDPNAGVGESLLNLTTGVFRMVTGRIASFSPKTVRVNTPVATIGVRGTDFWGEVTAEKLALVMISGKGVFAENVAGRVDLLEPRLLTTTTSYTVAPSAPVKISEDQLAEAAKTVSF